MLDFSHIHPGELLTSLILVLAALLLLGLGRLAYGWWQRGVDIGAELVDKDNAAFALQQTGYWGALIIVLGAAVHGPGNGLALDLVDLLVWGITGIVLLLASLWINEHFILHRFSNHDELFKDQNAGTGAVEAGSAIASALMVFGALSGEGGGFDTALGFWAIGQLVLVLAGRVYAATLSYDLHHEIGERNNLPAGIAFAGALVATGNLVRIGTQGDFDGWSAGLADVLVYTLAALVLTPLIRWLADLVLLPGRTLAQEIVDQERPNIGAGLVEAFAYVGTTMLIGWAI
jgi:uncharacterized membrane protein YjfL (UPF0719 family)